VEHAFARHNLSTFCEKFLRQDQLTLSSSGRTEVNPHLMLIDDADRQAKWYFALKANLLESRRTGAPMVHPMNGTGYAAVAIVVSHRLKLKRKQTFVATKRAGEVEGSDSLLAVGGVHHDCRID